MSQLAREKETVQERLVQITRERDTALCVLGEQASSMGDAPDPVA